MKALIQPVKALCFQLLHGVQIALLHTSYALCKPFVTPEAGVWVMGVREVANCLHHMAGAFERVISVNFAPNRFYPGNAYTINLGRLPDLAARLLALLVGPLLLGYLACRASHFLYLWNVGFLLGQPDGRAYEFRFLKRRGKTIVVLFCGSEIRSPRLSLAHGEQIGYETMMSCLALCNPSYISDAKEASVRRVAEAADTYADHIFNAPVDQRAYLTRQTHPFPYFYPDALFEKHEAKFEAMETIRIVHAPSSPLIKGTLLVRAAVKNLKERGYRFEYIEITNADNQVVLEALRGAHIVINELYAFLPGILGVEAMAAHCALLTSANPAIEPSLPADSGDAWLITRYWDVTEKLQSLLDHPERIRAYADAGYDWAYRHARRSVSQERLRTILKGGT